MSVESINKYIHNMKQWDLLELRDIFTSDEYIQCSNIEDFPKHFD